MGDNSSLVYPRAHEQYDMGQPCKGRLDLYQRIEVTNSFLVATIKNQKADDVNFNRIYLKEQIQNTVSTCN